MLSGCYRDWTLESDLSVKVLETVPIEFQGPRSGGLIRTSVSCKRRGTGTEIELYGMRDLLGGRRSEEK